VALVSLVLTDSGLDPRSLKLEITESVVMQDAPATLTTLHTLRDLGIRLAIDDFGTGYSSLGYLKRFPIDTLKIDRSFVEGITTDPEDTAIVQAVISVAKSLGLSVTAEGIETEEQLLRLRELGCDRGQGFYFGRPLAADIAFESLERHPAVVTLPRVERNAEPAPRPAVAALPAAVAAAVDPEPVSAPGVVEPVLVPPPVPATPVLVAPVIADTAIAAPVATAPAVVAPVVEEAPEPSGAAAAPAPAVAPAPPADPEPAPSAPPRDSGARLPSEILQERIAELLKSRR
jgi:hypothetical protein